MVYIIGSKFKTNMYTEVLGMCSMELFFKNDDVKFKGVDVIGDISLHRDRKNKWKDCME